MADRESQTRHYFIDEGGDSTLFSRKGKVLIGSEGCSSFFMLGMLEVPDPSVLQSSLGDLRERLMTCHQCKQGREKQLSPFMQKMMCQKCVEKFSNS